jgi:hypothetical protein
LPSLLIERLGRFRPAPNGFSLLHAHNAVAVRDAEQRSVPGLLGGWSWDARSLLTFSGVNWTSLFGQVPLPWVTPTAWNNRGHLVVGQSALGLLQIAGSPSSSADVTTLDATIGLDAEGNLNVSQGGRFANQSLVFGLESGGKGQGLVADLGSWQSMAGSSPLIPSNDVPAGSIGHLSEVMSAGSDPQAQVHSEVLSIDEPALRW